MKHYLAPLVALALTGCSAINPPIQFVDDRQLVERHMGLFVGTRSILFHYENSVDLPSMIEDNYGVELGLNTMAPMIVSSTQRHADLLASDIDYCHTLARTLTVQNVSRQTMLAVGFGKTGSCRAEATGGQICAVVDGEEKVFVNGENLVSVGTYQLQCPDGTSPIVVDSVEAVRTTGD